MKAGTHILQRSGRHLQYFQTQLCQHFQRERKRAVRDLLPTKRQKTKRERRTQNSVGSENSLGITILWINHWPSRNQWWTSDFLKVLMIANNSGRKWIWHQSQWFAGSSDKYTKKNIGLSLAVGKCEKSSSQHAFFMFHRLFCICRMNFESLLFGRTSKQENNARILVNT